jgi:hypothetical protein
MHMRVVFFFSWILLRSAEAAKECYWANGQSLETTNTLSFVPCYPNANVSHCCLTGEVCMDNGLCFGANYGWVCLVLVFLNIPHIFEMLIHTHSPTAVPAPTLPGLWVQYAEVVHIAQNFQSGPTYYLYALMDPSGVATGAPGGRAQPTLLPTNFCHGQDPNCKAMMQL